MELLVKVWEGIREFLEVPNESTGFFFKHMRVLINHCHVLDLNPMFTSYQLASPRLASRYNFQSFAQIISLGNGQWALSK